MTSEELGHYEHTLLPIKSSILDALRIIDDSSRQIALVVDENKKLVGAVTDGDIRRAILAGVLLEESVTKVMNKTPISVRSDAGEESILHLMRENQVYRIPVVNSNGQVVGLVHIDDLIHEEAERHKEAISVDPSEVWVCLMLGGQGKRLRPLTDEIPKPMIDVGGAPLLETIVKRFVSQGFKKLFFSVNYREDVIREHFGDGSAFGAEIVYVPEEKNMGTAGALSLLPERPALPMIVMNGDILTDSNFKQLIDFHVQNNAKATMCVREYQHQVPYGVIQAVGTRLDSIVEKPCISYFTNAGIYIIDPSVLDYVPEDEYFDMPSLFDKLADAEQTSVVFPIREYWLDIGSMEDLEQARQDYKKVFVSAKK